VIYEFEAEVWVSGGEGAWHFLTLPADVGEGLKALRGPARNFGSMRVSASVGDTVWKTSLFPDRRLGTFLLPVKADVRRRLGLGVGDSVRVTIEVLI
jgi:hypothetical protein